MTGLEQARDVNFFTGDEAFVFHENIHTIIGLERQVHIEPFRSISVPCRPIPRRPDNSTT